MKIDYCCEKMMRAKVGLQKGHLCLVDVEIDHCPFCGERIEISLAQMMQGGLATPEDRIIVEGEGREAIAPVDRMEDILAKMGIGRREE